MKRKFFITVLIASCLTLAFFVFAYSNQKGSPQLEILVAPEDSLIKLDGKETKTGIQSLTQGAHQISAYRSGFISQNKTIKLAEKQHMFVGIILQPNSPRTANWYKTHPGDSNISQTINNRSFDQTATQAEQLNSLLKKLPHIGSGLNYRIDYGVPTKQLTNGSTGIYIRYRTESDKQAALQWIREQGSNPNSLDVVYIKGNF